MEWLHDSDVTKYSGQRFKKNTHADCCFYMNTFKNSDAIFILIKNKENGASIGTMTVYFNYRHDTADIGIMLGEKKIWGQGLGQEAWSLLLDTLLHTVNSRKVTGGTLSSNHGMISIMKKSNMQNDGVRTQQELLDGEPCDIVHFAAFRDML